MYRNSQDEGLGELISRLIESGKAYLQAEVNLFKRIAISRATAAGLGLAFGLGALLFVQAGLTGLVVALGLLIARWLGLAGGMAVAGVVALAIAGLLARTAMQRIVSAGKDA